MNDAMQRADEVAAMGPFRTQPGNTLSDAKGFYVDHEELNTLRTGYLACREALASLDAKYAIMLGEYEEMTAEVVRLREREAALVWLLLDNRRNDYVFEREPRDPVALCDALDKDWRKA